MPRNILQKSLKSAILLPHGLILLRVPKRRQTLGAQKNQRHAPCLQKTNRTAVGLSRPSTSKLLTCGQDVDGPEEPGHDDFYVMLLLIHKRHCVRNAGAGGAVAVDLVVAVRETERNPAHHPPVIAEPEVTPDQSGMMRQRRLRGGAETQRLRGQQKIPDIGPAIDRTVNAERLIGVNDGDVRCSEEIEILE